MEGHKSVNKSHKITQKSELRSVFLGKKKTKKKYGGQA